MTKPRVLLATSPGLLRQRHLPLLLEAAVRRALPWGKAEAEAVVAWGRKPSAARAERLAERLQLPLLRVEDGFLRSIQPGAAEAGLSLVVDDRGIYYDAGRPSKLEHLVLQTLDAAAELRAARLIAAWRELRVSKYNHAPELAVGRSRPYVLVVDQTHGDAAVEFGLAGPDSFRRMLDAAFAEYPDHDVLLKVHPEVVRGSKQGYFEPGALPGRDGLRLIGEDVHPAALIEGAAAVYVVTSQLGFEALLWGKPVRTFGMPFYAGWGLTRDELPAPARRRPVSLAQLVHAALVGYARYVDPETGQRCEVETLMSWLGLQRRFRLRYPPVVHACGFSRWKRPIVRDYFQGSRVVFIRRHQEAGAGATLALWGRRNQEAQARRDVRLLRLEDGFLRSVGLGADLVRPLSWVIDEMGIYYDATTPSGLEALLQRLVLTPEEESRACRLRQAIVEAELTKYNVGARGWTPPAGAGPIILVPGQVEDDLSIRWGALGLSSNLELVRAVRARNPQAYLLYKPHPDVVAGLRAPGQGEEDIPTLCDEVLVDVPMGSLLPCVDEVHVLTSLTGFEALLRKKKVVCYGAPFYAGWGLSTDIHADSPPLRRRTRRLSLDELVHGALIAYPTYISRCSGAFTTPERALRELLDWRARGADRLGLLRRVLRFARRLGRPG